MFSNMNKMKKDAISSRIIMLGDIDEENTNDVIFSILEINRLDDNKKKEQRAPIKLIINSYGGDIYRGLGVVDAILNSVTPVHTVCYGSAFSMGFVIMIAGHYRMISKHSTLMYHEGGFDLGMMKLTNHEYELKELKRIESLCDTLTLKRTSLTKKQLNSIKKEQKDWYIDAAEALEYGIVDEII